MKIYLPDKNSEVQNAFMHLFIIILYAVKHENMNEHASKLTAKNNSIYVRVAPQNLNYRLRVQHSRRIFNHFRVKYFSVKRVFQ